MIRIDRSDASERWVESRLTRALVSALGEERKTMLQLLLVAGRSSSDAAVRGLVERVLLLDEMVQTCTVLVDKEGSDEEREAEGS